jgi:hypothetical protein
MGVATKSAVADQTRTIRVGIRIAGDPTFHLDVAEGATIAEVTRGLVLPSEVDRVVIDGNFAATFSKASEVTIEDGRTLHYTGMVLIDVQLPNGKLQTHEMPVLGLLLGELPNAVAEVFAVTTEPHVLVDGESASEKQMATQTVSFEYTYEVPDP